MDRRELRQFLKDFFGSYHVHIPVTDEYVDGVFRSIDRNHDNKLQPEELIAFSEVFIGKLVALFIEAANAADLGASVPLEEEQKEWTGCNHRCWQSLQWEKSSQRLKSRQIPASISTVVWLSVLSRRNLNVVTECVSDAEQENIPVYYF